jgi:hypothetical protein
MRDPCAVWSKIRTRMMTRERKMTLTLGGPLLNEAFEGKQPLRTTIPISIFDIVAI